MRARVEGTEVRCLPKPLGVITPIDIQSIGLHSNVTYPGGMERQDIRQTCRLTALRWWKIDVAK